MNARQPDPSLFVFEISWEVCNMVGGIHTVLATKAAEMTARFGERYVVVGPKIWRRDRNAAQVFTPDTLFPELVERLKAEGISIETGHWHVPGRPRCILVDFTESYKRKDTILETLWREFGVDSLTGGWDYIEPVLFGYTAGKVLEACRDLLDDDLNIVAQWHEWMVGAGLLHLKKAAPEIASVFTTHATVLGRAISSSGEDLYAALAEIDAAERAKQLGVLAKFSLEKALANAADCFTTVSAVTAEEAEAFFGRKPDLLLPNALGDSFPEPRYAEAATVRAAKEALFRLAEAATGHRFSGDTTFLFLTSGRYEYVNKGANLIVDALPALSEGLAGIGARVIFLFALPSGVEGPDRAILEAKTHGAPVDRPRRVTHVLRNPDQDPLVGHLNRLGIGNEPEAKVQVLFVPIYLDGSDSLVDLTYYQLLAAVDLSAFPSHYEPWGYTPLESIGYGIPTVTSDLAGFGRWVKENPVSSPFACHVLPRAQTDYEDSVQALANHFLSFIKASAEERARAGQDAASLAKRATWNRFVKHYLEAYQDALNTRNKRFHGATARYKHLKKKGETPRAQLGGSRREDRPVYRLKPFTVLNRLPDPLRRLRELAYNLWWAWHPKAEALFAELDPELWRFSGHNPVQLLEGVTQSRLEEAAKDRDYRKRLDETLQSLDGYLAERAEPRNPHIAYFCMEFGIHQSLPLYSGGLGILAGDHLKEASDQGIPLVAVGLAYRQGYFTQSFDLEGNQEAESHILDFTALPMRPVKDDQGQPFSTKLLFPGRKLTLQVWSIQVGALTLLLLDTDHPANTRGDREITAKLYGGDLELRLQQEMVLGIGGRNVLQELGYPIKAFHMNEGHASFLVLSRLARIMQDSGADFRTALEVARQTSIFTTHTPVAAGHDQFSEDLMRPYFSLYQDVLNVSWEQIMDLGRYPERKKDQAFSMTLLGMRGSADVNAVSLIHRRVSQKNFNAVVPGFHWSEVPVGSVTNGVHLGTWLAPQVQDLLDEVAGDAWRHGRLGRECLAALEKIPADTLRRIRRDLKKQLLSALRSNLESVWRKRQDSPGILAKILEQLHPDALIVGFARRFAPYKRATLLFSEPETLAGILDDPNRPILFVFAGKAHPADRNGQELAKSIFRLSREERFLGRVLLLENYEMGLAKHLVQGCDLWLNTPTRPLEASGTSGMKSAMNGGLNLSVLDGWWAEGFNGRNGWALGREQTYENQELQDEHDSHHLYQLLSQTVMPSYFGDGEAGSTDAWIDMVREAMVSTLYRFSTTRMLHQYRETYYQPALMRAEALAANGYEAARRAASFKKKLIYHWHGVRIENAQVNALEGDSVFFGEPVDLSVQVQHPGLNPEDLKVEFINALRGSDEDHHDLEFIELHHQGEDRWHGVYTPQRSGAKAFGIRVVPRYPDGQTAADTDLGLVKWLE